MSGFQTEEERDKDGEANLKHYGVQDFKIIKKLE